MKGDNLSVSCGMSSCSFPGVADVIVDLVARHLTGNRNVFLCETSIRVPESEIHQHIHTDKPPFGHAYKSRDQKAV